MIGDLWLGDKHCDHLRLIILIVVVVVMVAMVGMVVARVCLLVMRPTKNLVLEGGHADHADSGDPCNGAIYGT